MNKADLVKEIAKNSGVSKKVAAQAVDTTVNTITSALKKGDRVALIGFGTFSVSQRKARSGRSVSSGQPIRISARKVAKFSPDNRLKKALGSEPDAFLSNLEKLSNFY